MSNGEFAQTLQRIAEIATLAGIKGHIDQQRQCFGASFSLDQGRSQVVQVRPTVRTPQGQQVVTFISPCRKVKTGFLKGLSKEDALGLLKRNEQIPFARYGLWSLDGEDMVVASVDHLLDTLDAQEFHAHIWAVACYADAYEREHGGDEF